MQGWWRLPRSVPGAGQEWALPGARSQEPGAGQEWALGDYPSLGGGDKEGLTIVAVALWLISTEQNRETGGCFVWAAWMIWATQSSSQIEPAVSGC